MKNPPQVLARKTVNKIKRWLNGDVEAAELNEELHRFHNFAYGDLNHKMLTIMNEARGAVRPTYTWGVLQAAYLAKTLGYKRISVIEFGVAGGNGLVSLEETARRVEPMFGVTIDVYGFDTGEGLPPADDYRDMPNIYTGGTYRMDEEGLRARLTTAKLILGDIKLTLPEFLKTKPAPVGFISVDVDLYTSTVDTLKILDADSSLLLPRVHCYFDDIMGCSCAEFLGERLALNEFNENHARAKISPIFGLWNYVPRRYSGEIWVHMIYMAHLLDHPLYCADDGMVTRKSEDLRTETKPPLAMAARSVAATL